VLANGDTVSQALCNDNQGSEDEWPTRTALDEWNFVGANDMDNQSLGKERFHKPAGVEQSRIAPTVEPHRAS